jgi:hypothetical protein
MRTRLPPPRNRSSELGKAAVDAETKSRRDLEVG